MVAEVSGSGLGLFNTSTSGSGLGGPNVGRARDRTFVNTATGNLVIQSNDCAVSHLVRAMELDRAQLLIMQIYFKAGPGRCRLPESNQAGCVRARHRRLGHGKPVRG